MGMLETLRNAFKIPDLRRKIILTIALLLVYRIGTYVPVPGYDPKLFQELLKQSNFQIAGIMDMISGGAFKQASVLAMGISPYITATIIMQLLTVAIPKLEQMQKEGEEGRKKIQKYSRVATIVLGLAQAVGLYFGFSGALTEGKSVMSFITVVLSFTAGTAFLMWLGEKMTEVGIGNGISLIIFAGILSRAPDGAMDSKTMYDGGTFGAGAQAAVFIGVFALVFILLVVAVIWVQQAERRIPVQYAKRVVGRKMYGGQNTHIPIKVNSAGVIPIIFAMSMMTFPATIVQFMGLKSTGHGWLLNWLIKSIGSPGQGPTYVMIYALLILFFTFFYTMMVFNPVELANNIKKNGGYIPGIRPGKPTSEYIMKVLNRITLFNAVFLALITLFPNIANLILPAITGSSIPNIWFAGTSLLIMVGVALETVKQLESQMLMRHYKGFLE